MSVKILTSHVGSLPRPDDLVEANEAHEDNSIDEATFDQQLAGAVKDVVARQQQIGIDFVNDGEYGHSMGQRYNYRAWWSYVFERLSGLELVDIEKEPVAAPAGSPSVRSQPTFGNRRDWAEFAEAYADPQSGCALPHRPTIRPVARGAISYVGQDDIQRDITNFKAALEAAGVKDGYLNSVAPGSCARFGNEFYASNDELLQACAEAMREEYKAIIDAGLILQLDDPSLAEHWDSITPAPSFEEYRALTAVKVEALNHAIRDLPTERIRLHLCWGSWHGPHVTDIPIKEILPVVLKANVGAYSFEAANARHEHEWDVWREVKLPDGKKILPGIVSHCTNVVEHPELVAQRITRFAEVVGPENVIASTDCGLGGRVHPQIAWAKLVSLVEGARLASAQF
jgi:5-methyltetrahydropteroyltriglutamate--homocysteine methyltransferase